MEGFGWFTFEVVKRLVLKNPQHQFYFFFDRSYDEKFIFAENVIPVVLKPQARRPILFKIWFNYSVTKALTKYDIDLFFSPDGYLSLKTTVPQIGVIHDLNFEHYPEDLPNWAVRYLKKYTPKFAEKANHIVTVSEYSKNDIVKSYHVSPNKITVAYNGANAVFKPIDEQTKNTIKEKYSKGEDFFVFVGALHARKNLKRLLIAFERFKIETSSKTKLLIVGEKLWSHTDFQSTLNALTVKDDIIFTGHLQLQELANITAAAKAMTFVSYFEGFGIPLVEAMQSGTPILCGNKTALPEIANEAALYCDPFSVEDITKKLTEMDTNQLLRTNLIDKGIVRAKDFSWDKTALIINEVIVDHLND